VIIRDGTRMARRCGQSLGKKSNFSDYWLLGLPRIIWPKNSGEKIFDIYAEADRLEAGGFSPIGGKSNQNIIQQRCRTDGTKALKCHHIAVSKVENNIATNNACEG
jgi:hypothetical protein